MIKTRIFIGSSNKDLAVDISKFSKIPLGKIELGKFSDGEIDVWIKEDVNNTNAIIVQSNSEPVNDNIIELALTADALKRSGALKITAVIPYFGYSRKEKQSRKGEPISAKVIAGVLVSAGVNKIICLDLHADAIVGFFDVPVIYLSAQQELAKQILKENPKNPIVVAPDVGGVKRARNFANIINAPLAVIEKHRQTKERDSIEVLSMSGQVKGDTAIIIDDVISTGSTIIESARALHQKGVEKIYVCATHGVFAKDAIKNIDNSAIDKLFVTDSIEPKIKSKKIKIVTVSGLIAKALKQEI